MHDIKTISKIQSELLISDASGVTFQLFGELPFALFDMEWFFVGESGRETFSLNATFINAEEQIISFGANDFLNMVTTHPEYNRWKMHIRSKKVPGEIYALYNNALVENLGKKPIYDYNFLRGDAIGYVNNIDTTTSRLVRPAVGGFGRFFMELIDEENRFRSIYETKITKFSLKNSTFNMYLDAFKINGYTPKCLTMSLRNSENPTNTTYRFPVYIESTSKKKYSIFCSFDLKELDLRPLFWDLSLDYVDESGKVIHTQIKNRSFTFSKKHFMKLFRDDSYDIGDNFIFYPYLSVYDVFCFMCRERNQTDTLMFRIKERLAAIYYRLNKKKFKDKQIHLVYEKFCGMAQDNGYYYFKYCMEHNVEEMLNRRIYFVIDKNSPDKAKLEPYKHRVLEFMSIKHIAYFLASRLLISSDTKTHAYAWRNRNSIIYPYIRNKKNVFLQHGVTALKRMEYLFGNGKNGGCNLFITTSLFEKEIITDYFNYGENSVAITGFSRWDVLEDKSEGKRELLLMPTWRNWLEEVPESIFRESTYYKEYAAFLGSLSLSFLLEKYDMMLKFYIHPKFRDYMGQFESHNSRIELIPFGQQPLNELLMSCRMLITDYSSVCWDVYYQKKPVIFYQFDLDEYLSHHGSYLDMEKDLFGPQTRTAAELLTVLEKACEDDFQLNAQAEKDHSYYFAYTDNENSKRIVDAIAEKGW